MSDSERPRKLDPLAIDRLAVFLPSDVAEQLVRCIPEIDWLDFEKTHEILDWLRTDILPKEKNPDRIARRAREYLHRPTDPQSNGKRSAQKDIDKGDLIELTAGEIMEEPPVCPTCMRRRDDLDKALWSRPGMSCPDCRAPLIRCCSAGCLIDEDTRPFLEAYNRHMEEHIRSTFNPGFRFERVTRDTTA